MRLITQHRLRLITQHIVSCQTRYNIESGVQGGVQVYTYAQIELTGLIPLVYAVLCGDEYPNMACVCLCDAGTVRRCCARTAWHWGPCRRASRASPRSRSESWARSTRGFAPDACPPPSTYRSVTPHAPPNTCLTHRCPSHGPEPLLSVCDSSQSVLKT